MTGTSAVIKAIWKQEIEGIYEKVLEDIYKEGTVPMKLLKDNEKISIKKGVRLDDTVSPKLFMAVLEEDFKNLECNEAGVEMNGDM